MKGKIIKGIAGFYYVHVPEINEVFECKAKGIFRLQNVKPLVGDDTEIDISGQPKGKGVITRILPRKNELIRPAVANVDQAMVIFAAAEPAPNLNLLDRFLITMGRQNIHTIICFNKKDIVDRKDMEMLTETYIRSGHKVLGISVLKQDGTAAVKELLKGRTTVLAGPSGVGKSSLINTLNPDARMEVGTVSEKIKRGRHTTRHSELIYVDDNSYVMDTPGFSSLYIDDIEEEELKNYYNEFNEFKDKCRFIGCMHLNEPGCAVKEALSEGKISSIRYDNYRALYEELKDIKKY